MAACFDELQVMRDRYTLRCQLRHKIVGFVAGYGFIFAPLITLVGKELCERWEEFVKIDEHIGNLLHAQDSFFSAMGQGEPTDVLADDEEPTKPHVMQWEIEHPGAWVGMHCGFVMKMLGGTRKGENREGLNTGTVSVLLCRCLTLSTHIYELSVGPFAESISEQFGKDIENVLLK
jgi:hypothetical protein